MMPSYVRRPVDRLVELFSPEMILVYCIDTKWEPDWIRLNVVMVMPEGMPKEELKSIKYAADEEFFNMGYYSTMTVIDRAQYERNLGDGYTKTNLAARTGYVAYEA